MRDKGLVFDEMRKARQTIERPFSERWIEFALEFGLILLLGLSAARELGISARSHTQVREISVRGPSGARLDSVRAAVGGANDGADAS
jgi:hypothetical protein